MSPYTRRRKYKRALLPKKALWKRKVPGKERFLTYKRRFMDSLLRGLQLLGIVMLVVGVIYGAYYLITQATFFKISVIEIRGARGFVNSTDLENVARDYVDKKTIFEVNTTQIAQKLSERFQGAKAIRVVRKLPDTIKLIVEERTPLALIFNDSSNEYFLIDDEGYVLGVVDEEKTNLPEIRYEGDIRVGYFIDSGLVPAYLEITAALKAEPLGVSSMSFYPTYVRIFAEDGMEVLISEDKNKKNAVRFVVDLVKQMLSEGKKVSKVDLRYDKVIVSY